MDINVETMIDSLTCMIRVISKDSKLRKWFFRLEQQSEVERRNAIYALSQRMSTSHEDPSLITSLKLLAVPKVFEAARTTLHDL